MNKIYLIIFFFSFMKSMYFDTDFGTIIPDDTNVINKPFMGGFNKPKI